MRKNKRRGAGEQGERRFPPSRRTKDEANNGESFSEAEVAGRSIFSPVSMQPREREGEREGTGEEGAEKGEKRGGMSVN